MRKYCSAAWSINLLIWRRTNPIWIQPLGREFPRWFSWSLWDTMAFSKVASLPPAIRSILARTVSCCPISRRLWNKKAVFYSVLRVVRTTTWRTIRRCNNVKYVELSIKPKFTGIEELSLVLLRPNFDSQTIRRIILRYSLYTVRICVIPVKDSFK